MGDHTRAGISCPLVPTRLVNLSNPKDNILCGSTPRGQPEAAGSVPETSADLAGVGRPRPGPTAVDCFLERAAKN